MIFDLLTGKEIEETEQSRYDVMEGTSVATILWWLENKIDPKLSNVVKDNDYQTVIRIVNQWAEDN